MYTYIVLVPVIRGISSCAVVDFRKLSVLRCYIQNIDLCYVVESIDQGTYR